VQASGKPPNLPHFEDGILNFSPQAVLEETILFRKFLQKIMELNKEASRFGNVWTLAVNNNLHDLLEPLRVK
jgi:hypothetical protein